MSIRRRRQVSTVARRDRDLRRPHHLLAGICPRHSRVRSRTRSTGWSSSDVFPGKPVALFNASERGVAMQAALRLTLETMSARMVDVATITVPLLGKQTDAAALAADPDDLRTKIRDALEAYARFLA